MPSTNDSTCRQVYLLSLWREAPGAPWRAALRLAGSEERIGFADLEALALFLLRLDGRPKSSTTATTEATEDSDIREQFD